MEQRTTAADNRKILKNMAAGGNGAVIDFTEEVETMLPDGTKQKRYVLHTFIDNTHITISSGILIKPEDIDSLT